MVVWNFSAEALEGRCDAYAQAVSGLKECYGFDFVSMGLTEQVGAPLRWVYSAGATGERHKRIALAPGHGIGGIVIKAGKPMWFDDIDEQIDPCEYSSYPIVFAEDLRSFCCLPLVRSGRVVGALLCAFRSPGARHRDAYLQLIADLDGRFCDCGVVADDFISLGGPERPASPAVAAPGRSEISRIIEAQENERKRIARELHDGIAQEILMLSFAVRRLDALVDSELAKGLVGEATGRIDHILEEIHNISVELRPSTLDHLGLVAALRSQTAMFEKTYGVEVAFGGSLPTDTRFAPEVETQAYRVCQEAILNSCKYSGADRATVRLDLENGWLRVQVADEGCGFDVAHPVVRGSGCGLAGMRERAALVAGTLSIESGDRGTVVELRIPVGDAVEEGAR